jgi:hypothetical protein
MDTETVTKQSEKVQMELKRGKNRSFDIAFKLNVVECAEKSTNRGAAANYKVDEKSIRMWRKNKASLLVLPTKKERRRLTQAYEPRNGRKYAGMD